MADNGNGFITLHRKMVNTSFYKNSKAVHLAVHLLFNATYKDQIINVGLQEVTLRRGQVLGGFKRILRELGWNKSCVRRAFYRLRDDGFCTHYATNKYAIITISNYNLYQGVQIDTPESLGGSETTPMGGHNETLECRNPTPYNKGLYNNKNNRAHFEDLWSQYPKKVGRKKAIGYFNSSVKKQENWDDIQQALLNYKNSERAQDPKYIADGKTWFNNWEDWITDPDSVVANPEFDEIKEALK